MISRISYLAKLSQYSSQAMVYCRRLAEMIGICADQTAAKAMNGEDTDASSYHG
jgi:hypothetical protein